MTSSFGISRMSSTDLGMRRRSVHFGRSRRVVRMTVRRGVYLSRWGVLALLSATGFTAAGREWCARGGGCWPRIVAVGVAVGGAGAAALDEEPIRHSGVVTMGPMCLGGSCSTLTMRDETASEGVEVPVREPGQRKRSFAARREASRRMAAGVTGAAIGLAASTDSRLYRLAVL